MCQQIHWSSSAFPSQIVSTLIAFVPQQLKKGKLSLTRCSVTCEVIETYESSAEMLKL